MIDQLSGRVVVMSFGGFSGLDHGRYPIPWGFEARYWAERLSHITRKQLKDAPALSDDFVG